MIDAQLGTNGQARKRFRDRRLDVEADRESAISAPATANGARIDHRLASKPPHGIMRIGELRGIEALVIAPDFATDLGRDLVVDRVGQVLRYSIRAGLRGIVMGEIKIGDGSKLIGDLPSRSDCV